MRSNNQSNRLIKWIVIAGDFVLLNLVLYGFSLWHTGMAVWDAPKTREFFLICNMALLMSEWQFHTTIHRRLVSAGDVLRRIMLLTMTQTLIAYLILKGLDYHTPVGRLLMMQGTMMFVLMVMKRLIERVIIKWYRRSGGNTRMVTFIGDDSELDNVKERLMKDPTLGYKVVAEYKDANGFLDAIGCGGAEEAMGDELYLCISRREKAVVRKISTLCDQHVVRFYYVPVSVESLGINLKREMLEDMELFTTYENPLENPVNKAMKRVFDVVMSIAFLIPTAVVFPFIWLIIKIQSPGPIFFKQQRTGLDGKTFYCYKFRSMHVNKDADRVQATKDDPRKYPFGNFMRKANIDELPQFLNVLKGNMSIVGPRPHMLAHTEMYSKLIDQYMVRHFVKPGVTGWAQVTGYRGETRELWQMEGRVRRDIWYMEHWSIWLDIRIIWLTVKTIFVHDEHAY